MKRKKRIGIDARFWHSINTGLSQYTKKLIKDLAKKDKENEYIIFLRKHDLEEWDIIAKNFHPVVVDVVHYSFAEQIIFLWKLLISKLDLVLFLNLNYPVFYPKKFIVVVHDLAYLHFSPKRLKSRIFRWGYLLTIWMAARRATKIIARSETIKSEIMHRFKVDSGKIVAILFVPLGESFLQLDQKKVSLLKKELHLSYPIIFYIGGWREHKNIPALLEAFAKLRKKKFLAHLLLGSNPDNAVLQLVKNHPFKKDIIVTGFIPEKEKASFYKSADIFIFPSLYEGFGLPIIEAQYMNIPVAASNIDVLKEVGGEGAIYFDPVNPEDISVKIIQILQDPKLREKIIKKGKSNIIRMNWEKSADEFVNLIKEQIY